MITSRSRARQDAARRAARARRLRQAVEERPALRAGPSPYDDGILAVLVRLR
ncbi:MULTISPECIES: hypothetical protein [unclassified Streptomyces]|uniref:hypothetical protein n=1 Tax=unclassified Streptomyces TaxID=2593676 RepID=UPI0015A6B068|nr:MULTISPECIES: hypothetical protein [unclassified Streptomyces]